MTDSNRGAAWSMRAAVVVLVGLIVLASGPLSLAGKEPSITLDPDRGRAGTVVTVTGDGFQLETKVAIYWDGATYVGLGVSFDGTFTAEFEVPAADAGEHKVTACAYNAEECDGGTATAVFTLVIKQTPIPGTPPPTRQPTLPPPTQAPTGDPPVVVPPDLVLAPIPWLSNGSGPCATLPIAEPLRREDFESPDGSWSRWVTSGQRGTPEVATSSGQSAFSSVYDDFGSYERPIILDFGPNAEREVAVHVGREQPRPGAGDVLVRLSGFGVGPTGRVIEIAHAQLSLEEGAVPFDRCLKVVAPGDIPIRMVAIDYFDQEGRSSTEQRWVDDVVLGGAEPISLGSAGNVALPEVWIDSPLDGGAWTQSAPVRLLARIRDQSARPPTARILVNGRPATPAIAISRAPGEDPFLYNLDASIQLFHGLRADDTNEIELIVTSGSLGGSTHSRTRFSFAPPVAGNLRIVGLEVTQAVQVPGNLIPLIADKKTVARVYVEGWPDGRGFWQNVEVVFATTTADGTRRVRTLPVAAAGSTAERAGSYWNVREVPLERAETAQGQLNIDVSIRSRDGRQQARLDDDRLATSVNFLPPLNYTAYGVLTSFPLDVTTNSWDKLETFMRYVENVYPVSAAQILPIAGIGQTPQQVADLAGLRELTGRLLMRLPTGQSIFGLWPGSSVIAAECDADSCIIGLASGRRTDGYGDTRGGPVVMAQELAHAEGLGWHAETPAHPAPPAQGWTNPAWPWEHSGIGHPGMDTRGTSPLGIRPDSPGSDLHTHDFMSYGGGESWTSPYTYCALLEILTSRVQRCPPGAATFPYQRYASMPAVPPRAVAGRLTSNTAPLALNTDATESEFLLISGSIAWDGLSATIEPIESMVRATAIPFAGDGDAFALEIRDGGGATLVRLPFTPLATHLHEGEEVPFGFTVARPDGAASVAVTRGESVLGEIRATANKPVVSVDRELLPARLDGPATLTWTASDADGDALTYAVEASFDGLQTWLPIGVALTEPGLVLDPATLPGSGEARLRVYVSDGFNSAVAEAGPIKIPGHAPSIALRAPTDDQAVDQGAPVLLEVEAADLEDGALDGRAVTWTSDRDGELGEGRWLVLGSLSVGQHVITATATDSDGSTATATARLTVRAAAAALASAAPSPTSAMPSPSSAAPSPSSDGPEAETGAASQQFVIGGLLALALLAGLGILVIRRRRLQA